jgi:hypothetical protein
VAKGGDDHCEAEVSYRFGGGERGLSGSMLFLFAGEEKAESERERGFIFLSEEFDVDSVEACACTCEDSYAWGSSVMSSSSHMPISPPVPKKGRKMA